MAVNNVFVKPDVILGTALGVLERDVVLPNTVTRWGTDVFKGARGDTVNVRVPATTTAYRRALRAEGEARKIQLTELTEKSLPVTLDVRVESAVPIWDEEATLDITNFTEQILMPQMRAVALETEEIVYETIKNAPYATDHVVTWGNDAWADFVKTVTILNKSEASPDGRILLCGANAYARILTDAALRPGVNPTGLGENALRTATVGKVAGVDIVVSHLVPDNEAYMYTKDAFIFANGAPVVPQGAKTGSSKSFQGFSLRWLMDYDADYATDRSVLTTYAGGKAVNDGPNDKVVRAVKITVPNLGS